MPPLLTSSRKRKALAQRRDKREIFIISAKLRNSHSSVIPTFLAKTIHHRSSQGSSTCNYLLLVTDSYHQLVAHYKQLQEDPETKSKDEDFVLDDPSNLRLRDLRGIAPSQIYLDSMLLKDVCQAYTFTSSHILVQKLPEGETEVKKDKDTIVFFLQQFFPATWTFGPRFEFTTTDEEKLTDFRDRV